MTTPLSTSEQDQVISSSIEIMLHNFSLASHIADLLCEYSIAAYPPPKANVCLRGRGRGVDIPGQNCGFFTTPVIQMAILDCRKSIDFFGLAFDSESRSIIPSKKRRKDDLGIEHFGLQRLTVDQLIGASNAILSVPLIQILADVCLWSNKQLAHLTLKQPDIKFEAIRDVSKAMINAYVCFLFDALGRPRPRIQPYISPIL
jgi:hypothetical protein